MSRSIRAAQGIGALIYGVALLAAAPAMAQNATVAVAQGSADAGKVQAKLGEVEVRAKVVELDQAQRIITLRKPNGELVSLDVPAEVKNLSAVRVGDDLVLRYAVAAVVALEPTDTKTGVRERVESTSSAAAPAGSMPGVTARRRIDLLAVVQSLDKKARKATLRGPKRSIQVDIPADVDLSKVKVGSEVKATILEAAALSVEHAADKGGKK